MKALRTAMMASALLLAAALPAHADPISTTIASVLSYLGAAKAAASVAAWTWAATATAAAVNIAVAAGLAGLSSLLRGGRGTERDDSGLRLQAGGIQPRTFMVGTGATGGKLVYANTWGNPDSTPNAFLVMVVALEDIPVTGLTGIWVNGEPATYGSGTPNASLGYAIPEFHKDDRDYLWIKFYDGTQTAADTYLVDAFGDHVEFPYASDRVGYGIPYVIVTARVNPELFAGPPSIVYEMQGSKFYDPRQDTTVGGSGSHRFDTPSTWAYTDNPKVIEYNILRGIRYDGEWIYGLQSLTVGRLPLDSWFAAMNECDTLVAKNGGGTEPQYRCGGEISFGTPPADTIADLNKACNGELAEIGGAYETHCGAPGSSVLSFTDGDIIVTEGQTFDQFPGLDSLINAVTASYPEPLQGWAQTDAPPLYSPGLEEADGDRRLTTNINYGLAPYLEQVERLMKSALQEERRFRKHTIVMPPSVWGVTPLTFVSWTSTRNGYSDKLFKVTAVVDTAGLDQVLTLREVDPSDYDWTPGTDFKPKAVGPLAIVYPAAQAIVGWDAEPATVSGDGGRAQPGIKLLWDVTDIDDVDGVIFELRQAGETDVLKSGETPHSVEQFQLGEVIISGGLSSNTAYEVRGKYRPISTRETTWSSWLAVTTPTVTIAAPDIGEFTVDISKLTQEVQDEIARIAPTALSVKDAHSLVRDLQRRVEDSAEALISLVAIANSNAQRIGAALVYAKEEITTRFLGELAAEASARRDLAVIVGGITSGFGETLPVLAARVSSLETATANLETGKVSASSFDVLNAQINEPLIGLAAQVAQNTDAIALLDPSSSTATIKQLAAAARATGVKLDDLGETLQTILGHVNDNAKRIAATVAFVATTITASVTDGQSALAKSQADLGAMLQTADASLLASITSVDQASITRDSALSSRASTLEAALSSYTGANAVATAFTSVNASITSINSTLTSHTSSITSLTSDLSTANSNISTNASAITSLSTTVTSQGSSISSISSSLTSLSSTVGGHTTTLATYGSSIDGLKAQWGVQINSDGAVTGLIRLDSGDSESTFAVVANNLYYYDPTAGASPLFSIVGGTAYFVAPIVADSITVEHLQVGSATNVERGGGNVSGNLTGTFQQAGTQAVLSTPNTNPVTVTVLWQIATAGTGSTADLEITVQVQTPSTVTYTFTDQMTVGSGTTKAQVTPAMGLISGLVSGNATITVTAKLKGTGTGVQGNAQIYVEQVLR